MVHIARVLFERRRLSLMAIALRALAARPQSMLIGVMSLALIPLVCWVIETKNNAAIIFHLHC